MLSKLPLARRALVSAFALSAVVFAILIAAMLTLSSRQARQEAIENLQTQQQLVATFMDMVANQALARAENQHQALAKSIGEIKPGAAGEDGLPVVMAGEQTLNGNEALLEKFKAESGSEAAIMGIKDGKVYRLASILKINGKSATGTLIDSNDEVPKALLRGESYAGFTERGGAFYISLVKPLKNEKGEPVGGVSVRIALAGEVAAMEKAFKATKVGSTGEVFAVALNGVPKEKVGKIVLGQSRQGKFLSEVYEGENLARVSQIAEERSEEKPLLHSYEAEVDGKSDERVTVYAYAKRWGWLVGATAPLSEFTEQARGLSTRLAWIAVGCSLLLATLMWAAVRRATNSAGAIVNGLERFAEGALSLSLPARPKDSKNELDRIGAALDKACSAVGEAARASVAGSERALAVSESLEASAGRSSALSDGQSSAAGSIAQSVEQLSAVAESSAQNASQAASLAEETLAAAVAGEKSLGAAIEKLGGLSVKMTTTAREAKELEERSEQIRSIVSVITELSNQTNLLALNAAIEAARAGEQGRGFAVVADEVRKLAERTNQAAGKISEQVNAVAAQTAQASAGMTQASAELQEGLKVNMEGVAALKEIALKARSASAASAELALASGEQAKGARLIATDAERIASGSQELTESAAKTEGYSAELAVIARDLKASAGFFKN